MGCYWQFAKLTLIHKWHVFRLSLKYGIPILGLLHDWSKFRPSEFIPHARYFGGNGTLAELDRAWLHHQRRNKHHWEYWVVRTCGGEWVAMDIPMIYRKEMLCDWIARARYRDKQPLIGWYRQQDMLLHPRTRAWIETELC